ncbi:hypothetical protein FHS20_001328 [Phyllobacterium endophyticum]|uniref:Uncharacterized protein n=1 Tax=Phyllobacterium endophyticum TaxID=1149773 RepID=A0A2P7AUT6_9HYPH|nr:hypothetical protein [Phyllobacterium endophyticum]PSH57984.1 hypothetical protein CU100_09940 [Phyllobacterium endophyticum]
MRYTETEQRILDLAFDRASRRLRRDPHTDHPRADHLRRMVVALFEKGFRDFELIAGMAANKKYIIERKSKRKANGIGRGPLSPQAGSRSARHSTPD